MENSFDYNVWKLEFGKPKEECVIYERIQKNIDVFEKKEYKDQNNCYEYYFSYKHGLSFSFNNSIFSSVFLYGKADKRFSCYQGSIPYCLSFDMNNSEIVGFLGEPKKKSGGGTVPISLSYERLGIDITFLSPVWSLLDNKIGFICCFFPKKEEKNVICGVCGKESSSFCANCQLISYCSTNCQKVHWKFHKTNCQKYSETKNKQ
jgi:hypothetical protein